jgi:hypothetical protein
MKPIYNLEVNAASFLIREKIMSNIFDEIALNNMAALGRVFVNEMLKGGIREKSTVNNQIHTGSPEYWEAYDKYKKAESQVAQESQND